MRLALLIGFVEMVFGRYFGFDILDFPRLDAVVALGIDDSTHEAVGV
jgi:hypothetical protein